MSAWPRRAAVMLGVVVACAASAAPALPAHQPARQPPAQVRPERSIRPGTPREAPGRTEAVGIGRTAYAALAFVLGIVALLFGLAATPASGIAGRRLPLLVADHRLDLVLVAAGLLTGLAVLLLLG